MHCLHRLLVSVQGRVGQGEVKPVDRTSPTAAATSRRTALHNSYRHHQFGLNRTAHRKGSSSDFWWLAVAVGSVPNSRWASRLGRHPGPKKGKSGKVEEALLPLRWGILKCHLGAHQTLATLGELATETCAVSIKGCWSFLHIN